VSAHIRTLLCVAGEASGDALLAPIVSSLTTLHGVRCVGTAGDASAAAGMELWAHVRDFAAHGLIEAAPAVPALLALWRRLVRGLDTVDAVLLVDAPELNIRLLPRARRAGKPTLWLAPPQTWAWRSGRLQTIATADAIACLFPFEVDFHRTHGIPAHFVGHPAAERTAFTPPSGRRLVLLPGSRPGTAPRLLEPMLAAARRLADAGLIDGVDLGLAPTLSSALIAPVLSRGGVEVRIHSSATEALAAGDVALAGVGTVTLEAALAGRPTLAIARLHPLSAAVASRWVNAPHLALPNLVLGRRALPELWQDAVTPGAMETELRALLTPEARARAAADAERLRSLLAPGPTAFGPRVAALVVQSLARPGTGAVVSPGAAALSSAPRRPPEISVDTPQKPLIVVPTYNERENLPPLLDRIFEVVPDVTVLVVDDNSPDGTGKLADERAAVDPRVQVLHRAGKEGLGKAYLAGFQWALARDFTHVFEMDADFSHDPATLPRFLEAARTADLVLGSRWVEGGGTVGWPVQRRLLSKCGSLYARTVLGVDIRDLTGGFKCFNRRVLQAIDLDTVQTRGYGFQIELTFRALRQGFKVVEIPIRFADRVAGQSKMSFRIMSEAFTMVWKLRLGA
jgi:dolichol-phosphate mannosyltransferase